MYGLDLYIEPRGDTIDYRWTAWPEDEPCPKLWGDPLADELLAF